MILIGLTGGIASGKSTVARALADRGAVVINADELGHSVIGPGGSVVDEVIAAFGRDVLGHDGAIDRAKLGSIVFSDKDKLRLLESISHPAIFREVARLIDQHRDFDALVVLDAALLVETLPDRGRSIGMDALVVVNAWPKDQIERMVELRGMSPEDAESRMAAQTTAESRLAIADYVIDNRGTLEELEEGVELLWQDLQRRFKEARPSSS